MAESGCLKDGHFQNLQVEGITSDLGTGTLKYQSADLPLITMMGLNPIWAFNFGDPSDPASATADGAKDTVLTPVGTLYNLSKCLENIANQSTVVSVAQANALFGVEDGAVEGTDVPIADGATNPLIPDHLNITRVTGNVGANLTLTASTIDYQANERCLVIFTGNVFTASQALVLTMEGNSALNQAGCETVVSGAGNDIMTRSAAASNGNTVITIAAVGADTTILPGSYIYLIAENNSNEVDVKVCIRTTGGTVTVGYS